MSYKMKSKFKRASRDAGIALLTTVLLLLLMSSLLVGFTILLVSDQQLSSANDDQVHAFYGAEAGMEQLTAGLGDLFAQTYSPSISQINALTATPPTIPGMNYLKGDGSTGFTITPSSLDTNGNPQPTVTTIKSGVYQGMTALATDYVLVVNARTAVGREVTLKRTTQTVGIPMFQFGIFGDSDLSFFPGPNFQFGGRTHTNGNLFLAAGSTLTMKDKVDAYKDVIRYTLSNGYVTTSNYGGNVSITTSPGTASYRTLDITEGSLQQGVGSAANTNWGTISTGYYAGNLRNGAGSSSVPPNGTGAKQLNLGIVTIGSGATQSIDLIRRPVGGEAPKITAERYFAQASLKILLSDSANDIMNLPCVNPSSTPIDLSTMAGPPATWPAPASNIAAALGAKALPLATSDALGGASYNGTDGYFLPNGYPIIKGFLLIEAQENGYSNGSAACGAWTDVTQEILKLGYVGRNIDPVSQSLDGNTLNPQWVQNTNLMESGRAPALPYLPQKVSGAPNTTLMALSYQNGAMYSSANGTTSTTQFTAPSTSAAPTFVCPDPHPNAIIRLERVRDNPSSVPVATGKLGVPASNKPLVAKVSEVCGVDPVTGNVLATNSYDFWPNVLFDTREGTLRDTAMANGSTLAGTGTGALTVQIPPNPTLNGAMSYIEVDMKNLTKWFKGTLGSTGTNTFDAVIAPNNFLVYFSDRRGNYVTAATWATWPPVSPSLHETGESGWNDIVNATSSPTSGCPDNAFDTGEDIDGTGTLYTYGANAAYATHIHAPGVAPLSSLTGGQLGILSGLSGTALTTNKNCTSVPAYASAIWPMVVATNPDSLRENPPLFFRRAVKLVNGNDLTTLPTCASGNTCGLAFSAENPIYIQGDYNANSKGNGWGDPFVPSSVAGDAVTLLSVQWNDVNSFVGPYNLTYRQGNNTFYRTAIIGGQTLSFPQPSGTGNDYGTDGGVHNFLRYIEAWGGTLNYQGSIVSLYTNRQATGTFKCCNTVYSPPTRGYLFDITFLNPTQLPPRTPLFRDVNTTGFSQILVPGVYQ
jgi:hypothetical protein